PTNIPDQVDLPALRERYRQERDKRIRPEGQKQYSKVKEEFANEYEQDPHMPVVPRDPISEDLDVAILGTGVVTKRPVVVTDANGQDSISIRSMVYLALSYDHRLVDGADASRFLVDVKTRLEEANFDSVLGL
ncbi:MAG: hypothetical protein RL096_936, partial [Actinomycetota bacterium]